VNASSHRHREHPDLRPGDTRVGPVGPRAGVRGASVALGESRSGSAPQDHANALTPIIVQGTLGIPRRSSRSPPSPSRSAPAPLAEWGSMMGSKRNSVFAATPHPASRRAAIVLTCLPSTSSARCARRAQPEAQSMTFRSTARSCRTAASRSWGPAVQRPGARGDRPCWRSRLRTSFHTPRRRSGRLTGSDSSVDPARSSGSSASPVAGKSVTRCRSCAWWPIRPDRGAEDPLRRQDCSAEPGVDAQDPGERSP